METPGIRSPLVEAGDTCRKIRCSGKTTVRAIIVQGMTSNIVITRIPESPSGLKALETLVIADPHPTTWASLAVFRGGSKGLASTFSRSTASRVQGGSRVPRTASGHGASRCVKAGVRIEDDLEVSYGWRTTFGFAGQSQEHQVESIAGREGLPSGK